MSATVSADQTHPNFLFVIADDCTWSDLGCYGGQAKTPHLDQLVSEGLKFNNCFQAAPMCSPTRHCLYTGLYPVKSGAHPNHTYVKPHVKSIAHYLKSAGYRVALSGKRHIKPVENFPFEYSEDKTDKGREKNPDFEVVEEFLKECDQTETPFCLFVCSTEPHTPYTRGNPADYDVDKIELPPHYVDTPETRSLFQRYLAEITFYDSQVGQCLEMIQRFNHFDDTLVMVVSEQGNSFPFAKWCCYDAGLKSGMIVRWPGHVQPKTETNAMVEYVDVVPTFLDAAGIETPEALDGKSFLPVLLGQSDEHKQYSFAIQTSRGIYSGPEHYGIRSVRGTRYRYVRNLTPEAEFQNTVMKSPFFKSWQRAAEQGSEHAQWAVRRYKKRPGEELFDCLDDPWNRNNLAEDPDSQRIKQHLSSELDRWMVSQGDLGRETEMDAKNRQWDFKKNRPQSESMTRKHDQ